MKKYDIFGAVNLSYISNLFKVLCFFTLSEVRATLQVLVMAVRTWLCWFRLTSRHVNPPLVTVGKAI